MDVQVQNAVEIAWNPQSEQSLKAQAFDFLNDLRANSSAWLVCLSLFTREPKAPEVVRHVALEVVNNAILTQQLDRQNTVSVKIGLVDYVRRTYSPLGGDLAYLDSPNVQNKVAQTLTLLFTALYGSGWESFFQDFSQPSDEELQSGRQFHPATLFYLRLLTSVHDEIADISINVTSDKQKLHAELKDLIRAKDASRIASSWKDILSRWQNLEYTVTELCLKVMGRWISWCDISLIANEQVLQSLFQIAGQQEIGSPNSSQSRVRDAAIDVFTETVSKKMKPTEKVELIQFMRVDAVVENLISSTPLHAARGMPQYDTDMAETVAKLVNSVVLDLIEVLNTESISEHIRQSASTLIQAFTPHLLRFLSDEYDEVCSTVMSAITEQLSFFRKLVQQNRSLTSPYSGMILPILNALVEKMRYDDTFSWSEEEEDNTDEAEFQELRKRLRVAQQNVAAIDESLFLETVAALVESTLERLRSERSKVNWRDLDLAMIETILVDELAVRNGGLSQKRTPSSTASDCAIRLTKLMLESDVASSGYPTVQLQFMDICVRYDQFFEQHEEYVPKVLEDFIRLGHSPTLKVRLRAWHNLLRYVQKLRLHIGNVAETIITALSDLLTIKAEVSNIADDESMSSSQKGQMEDSIFQGQLFLFEAIGCVSSISAVPTQTQVSLTKTILEPLLTGIQKELGAATSGDERAVLQVHHCIEAIGTLARGISDWVPGKSNIPVNQEVSTEFQKASELILLVLDSLKASMTIRSAARFVFSRLVGVLGFKVLQQLPQWIEGLLAESSTKDEMATFLRLLDQVIFGFKKEIFSVFDLLLTPLLQRIFSGFSQPTDGTDDELQLGDLRREYLTFLLILLNNNLDVTLVSETNQSTFDTIISTIEHFAKDTSESNDAKLALSVVIKMCDVWGGPVIYIPKNPTSAAPAPKLPGFNHFMLSRFSSLSWSILTRPDFNPRDPQVSRILGEIAVLQTIILSRTGQEYLVWLRQQELPNLGLQQSHIDEYCQALGTMESKSFKQFLTRFLGRSRA